MAAEPKDLTPEPLDQSDATGPAAAQALGQHRALRGDPGGGRQDDGGLPRTQRHRAVHPRSHEYCKLYIISELLTMFCFLATLSLDSNNCF